MVVSLIRRSTWSLGNIFTAFRSRYLSASALAKSLESSNNVVSERKSKRVDLDVLFKCCSDARIARKVHAHLVVTGNAHSLYISTRLVNLYAHLGDMFFARRTFDHIPLKDAYAWNSVISAYVRTVHFSEAVSCFYELISTSDPPDHYTFPPVIKACENLIDGARMHCWVLKMGFIWDVFVAASLIHMYSRFHLVGFARDIFKSMPIRDPASWNAMISGFCLNGNVEEAMNVVDEMLLQGINLDPVTVASILPVCAQVGDLLSGMLIHLYVIKHGLEYDLFVSNALINMYAKFGFLNHAQRVFDQMLAKDLVSWNSVVAAYEQNEDPVSALSFFEEMQNYGFEPDILTLVSLSSSIAQLGDCQNGRLLHGFITRRFCLVDDLLMGNAIVDMYSKLGVIEYARKVFQEMPIKDVISWNTLITGYSQNGFASEAIDVYNMMVACLDITPNQGTWVSILPAYSHVGALQQGMKIHGRIIKTPLHMDVFVGTCLIDMYGKCGRLDIALSLFYELSRQSSVPWNAIISCHGVHGFGEISIKLFEEMLLEGVKPDHVTFLSLLSACSHSGLVDQGQKFFYMMQEQYGIKPSLKHYGSMVDLLGRAGMLNKAYEFISNMPLKPDASVWGALLGACRIHGNIELGKFASDKLLAVDSENVGYYVLLSNIYANTGKWEGVNEVRSLALHKGLKKTPGWSSIEMNNNVDVFYSGNKSHPQSDEIYRELANLNAKVKNFGYAPDFGFVLQDVEDDEKEHILSSHSERLAIVFGLISTPPKSTIRIFKNLRVCGDCHNWTKFVSKLAERKIVVRDSNRFHHFQDGSCSCGDYW